ncbi:hypothetical protein RAN53_13130 [Halomonas sp. SSL-5]|uniref:hypothetical protein n=1 Tax=Halomonas sp. SSL-5 TaxID=3065855 RepID=UPI00273908FD|nr:hypothetical protein [Halomonas sp. SSL-5]MDY7117291.1 hypothetical protein [Halomonas sp. SSL-5]
MRPTRLPFAALRLTLPVTLALLAGCTTYTYPDRESETVWGVPAEDETLTREERENAPPRYRKPGEVPETR